VIGAGPGGYAAAIRLAQEGKRTLVVDRHGTGGVCLNVGCIPSKALISAAKSYERVRSAEQWGVRVSGSVEIDFAATQEWKEGVVQKLTGGVRKLLKGNGVELHIGEARVVAPNRVEIRGAEQTLLVESGAIVVASGSRPIEVPGFPFDEERILSSTGALALREIPRRLLVIGGGYIGLELGSVYAKLGSQLQVVEMTEQLLPGFDRDLVQVVQRKLKKRKVGIHLKTRAVGHELLADGSLRVHLEAVDGVKATQIEVDAVLVTVGRRPNVDGFGLEELGVALDGPFIQVDSRFQSSVPGIYAIGDAIGQPMLAHKAAREADLVTMALSATEATTIPPRGHIPGVVFTDPEVATVGRSERRLREAQVPYTVGKFPLLASGRALTNQATDGFIKVLAHADDHSLLGVQIVGDGASDMISEAVVAMDAGLTVHQLAAAIHPHPSLSEALMEAAKVAVGEAVHVLRR
jgi:dihydrolipoamide dehydrogenase